MITTISFILLSLAAVIQILFLIRKKQGHDPVSHFLIGGAFLLLLFNFIYRTIQIQFPAVTNTFEALVFFAMVTTILLVVYRIFLKKWEFPLIYFGCTILSIALLAIASSPIAPQDILPPVPALQSGWLVLHVTFSFIGESFFVVAFMAAIYYLALKDEEKKKNIYRLMYTFIAIGYPIYTVGALIFGAIWAQYAWGRFWSWDPKETWALITWLVYTAYLHIRFVPKIDKRVSAILSIIGFLFTMFTFLGVNFLLSGLHSYK